mgnify:CR=1 FL=1
MLVCILASMHNMHIITVGALESGNKWSLPDHRQDISDERRAERVSAEDTDKVSIGSGAPHHCS